ncbi:Uncharacterised protein [Yersinia enterocolitica]|uniref:Uncharacterized protein n=2 Tax=Yersinia enterocolitica TaxID=630 RepID=A0A0E1NH85_YEREN|nr:hypothetical protein CH48_454 [Yersinia enterocolitica]EHB19381.1 hypothetical protein IOK_18627 [Yersinia enterocolitica subsp. palearctica PhRBD_Ye1]CBX70938.1 unknown protein [Yersinia enterocolitica W22703]VEA99174.1 Uncharacterised protein [Yersinia enterocolitica subsp. enterocolitica]KGA58260.1 hypothetical protein DJ62_2653 [Yersinia enterocolitica]
MGILGLLPNKVDEDESVENNEYLTCLTEKELAELES